MDPKTAVVNEDTYKSDSVKAGLDGLVAYSKTISALKATLVLYLSRLGFLNLHEVSLDVQASNAQADITAQLDSDLDIGKIRSTLNQVSTTSPH